MDPLFSGGVSDYRFERSSNLAAAYGIAVTGTMVITSILFCTVAWKNWHWNRFLVVFLLMVLLIIDIPMFSANVLKLFSGLVATVFRFGDVYYYDHLEK